MTKAGKHGQICIIGAGPGGAATALGLAKLGLPSIVLDKHHFPRDKVCGDAISTKALTILGRIDPALLNSIHEHAESLPINRAVFHAPNHDILDIPFFGVAGQLSKAPGYLIKRLHFDHVLVKALKSNPLVYLQEGTEVRRIEKYPRGYRVFAADDQLLCDTPLLIDAGGAFSPFSRQHAGMQASDKHYAIALRAYASNLNWESAPDALTFYFLQHLTPGYLWIFPLPGGNANIGIGLRKDLLKRKKIKLEDWLLHNIRAHPQLADLFKHAQITHKIRGYGLPLGSRAQTISGDHYLLVGDAAHLIDPLTGEGIGNAIYSGHLAAQMAATAVQQQNFTRGYLQQYDRNVARILGSEMRLSYRLQQLLVYPRFCNLLVAFINSRKGLKDLISRMPADFDIRQALGNPTFWIKNIFLK